MHRNCCVFCIKLFQKTIIILWLSLEKGECFDFNDSLQCLWPSLYTNTLQRKVSHFSLLTCYPCYFYLHALILVAF